MTESNITTFINGCSDLLTNTIIDPIVQYLQSKDIQVSVEELKQVLNLPTTVRSTYIPAPTSHVSTMPMAFGGAVVPPMAASVAPTNLKKNTTTNPQSSTGQSCVYQLKRGAQRGAYCGKQVVAGSEYCTSHLKRPSLVKEGMIRNGALPGVAPSMGSIPGMSGVPSGYTPPSQSNQSTSSSLTVVPYDESRGLFKEPVHSFIVCRTDDGRVICIGKLIEDDNQIVPLNETEKITALNLNLVVNDQKITQNNTSNTQTESSNDLSPITQSSQVVPSIPVIPSSQVAPSSQGVPSIPVTPSIPVIPSSPASTSSPVISETPKQSTPSIPKAVLSAIPSAIPTIQSKQGITPLLPAGTPSIPQIPSLPNISGI